MFRSMRKNVRGEVVLAVVFLSFALLVLLDACSIDTAVREPDRQDETGRAAAQPEQPSRPGYCSALLSSSPGQLPGLNKMAQIEPDEWGAGGDRTHDYRIKSPLQDVSPAPLCVVSYLDCALIVHSRLPGGTAANRMR